MTETGGSITGPAHKLSCFSYVRESCLSMGDGSQAYVSSARPNVYITHAYGVLLRTKNTAEQ